MAVQLSIHKKSILALGKFFKIQFPCRLADQSPWTPLTVIDRKIAYSLVFVRLFLKKLKMVAVQNLKKS